MHGSNDVKQGGVLSPQLLNVYLVELLFRLKHSQVGCYICDVFAGALPYADDVILLAPTMNAIKIMLIISKEFDVQSGKKADNYIWFP